MLYICMVVWVFSCSDHCKKMGGFFSRLYCASTETLPFMFNISFLGN